jgi:hypothetical protein
MRMRSARATAAAVAMAAVCVGALGGVTPVAAADGSSSVCKNSAYWLTVAYPKQWKTNTATDANPRCTVFDPRDAEIAPESDEWAAIRISIVKRGTVRHFGVPTHAVVAGRSNGLFSTTVSGNEGMYQRGTRHSLYTAPLNREYEVAIRGVSAPNKRTQAEVEAMIQQVATTGVDITPPGDWQPPAS